MRIPKTELGEQLQATLHPKLLAWQIKPWLVEQARAPKP
jgi:hypothetical protein